MSSYSMFTSYAPTKNPMRVLAWRRLRLGRMVRLHHDMSGMAAWVFEDETLDVGNDRYFVL